MDRIAIECEEEERVPCGTEPYAIGEVLAELFAVYRERFPGAGLQPEGSTSCPPAAEASEQASQAAQSAGPMTRDPREATCPPSGEN